MQIIENPPNIELQKLQDILEKERPEGIVDIWVCLDPFYLALKSEGSIVGVASISLGYEVAEIYKIYVSPCHRRSGVAKQLFNEALQRFRQKGIKEVFVEVASEAGFLWLNSVVSGMKINSYGENKYSFQLYD